MRRFIEVAVLCLALSGQVVRASEAGSLKAALVRSSEVRVQDLRLKMPKGWKLSQEFKSEEQMVFGFVQGQAYLNLYVRPAGSIDLNSIFVNRSKIVRDWRLQNHGGFTWRVLDTGRTMHNSHDGFEFRSISAFMTEHQGHLYYGYAVAEKAKDASAMAAEFLGNTAPNTNDSLSGRSLTGPEYVGKKYYLGWGAAANGDPSNMHNEVKYDVQHTHDIFTTNVGGDYIGTKLIGVSAATGTAIRNAWKSLSGQMTVSDMFVQYSSGHGSTSGLGVGVTYKEIRDNALSYPAQEIIIFIMACHSGGLVDAFNAKKSEWENWQNEGRTLMVFASSTTQELSSTGPGTDPDEEGPYGSAGSAFGHALWKSLIGYADGYVDGVKDGFLSLGEIEKYTKWKTDQVGGHVPVSTGAYSAGLIMNKVPPKAFLDTLRGGTEGLSDDQVLERIQQLDASMRVH